MSALLDFLFGELSLMQLPDNFLRNRVTVFCVGLICLGTLFSLVVRLSGFSDIKGMGDFFALWSAPALARKIGVVSMYDLSAFKVAQQDLGISLGLSSSGEFGPFPYPPTFLAFMWPFGGMSVRVAYAAWVNRCTLKTC